MAREVKMWKSADGKIFPTRAEADAHDEAVAAMRDRRNCLGDEKVMYTALVDILRHKTLVPRVYPKEDAA